MSRRGCTMYRLDGIAGRRKVLGGPRPMLFAPCLRYTGLFGGLLSILSRPCGLHIEKGLVITRAGRH